ncbi:MAG: hypothetical protein ACK4IS_07330 [Erythrobacter sp.]
MSDSFKEIIAAPLTLWLAPVGTAFPELGAAPGAPWFKIGTNGDKNYEQGGVTVTHSASYNKVRPAGATGAVKAFLNDEDLMFAVTLLDISLDQYRTALNNNPITTVAAGVGTPGTKRVGLSHGMAPVNEYALLARGQSPEFEGLQMQYCVPRCFQSGAPAPQFRKGEPAALTIQFEALENMTAANEQERFGFMIAGSAAALPAG